MNPLGWDLTVFRVVNGWAGQLMILDGVMKAVGDPMTFSVPGLIGLSLWWWSRRREAYIGAPLLLALFVLVDAIGAQLKHVVQRPRPCQLLEVVQSSACGSTFGFPSNHALNTAAAAAYLHVLYPWTGWLTWPVVALVGIARVYTGAHYPTDVIGGWILGGAFGTLAAWALKRWMTFAAILPDRPAEHRADQ